MQQALHILIKDLRCFRNETGLMILLALSLGFDIPGFDVLLVIAAGLLISRVIHAETIPGDKQFWLTRPYRWTSLIAAKLLYIVLFINFPIFLGRVLVVLVDRIPLASALPGLFWTQLWLLLGVGTPFAVLATLTSGIIPFVFSVFALFAFGAMVPSVARYSQNFRDWYPGIAWIRLAVLLPIVIVSGALIGYLQYRGRRTFLARSIGVIGFLLIASSYWLMPETAGMAVQPRFSPIAMESTAFQLEVTPVIQMAPVGRYLQPVPGLDGLPAMDLDIAVSNVPPGTESYLDKMFISLIADDGRSWDFPLGALGGVTDNGHFSRKHIWIDPGFFLDEHDKPLRFVATALFSAFGNPRERTVKLDQTPRNVLDDMQCYWTRMGFLQCRSVSELTTRLVTAMAGGITVPLRSSLSYAPLPVNFQINPIIEDGSSQLQVSDAAVTFTVRDRLAHVRRDFVMAAVRLDDFLTKSKAP